MDALKMKFFEKSRQVLASKRKQLIKEGLGNKPNATRELQEQEIILELMNLLNFKEQCGGSYLGISVSDSRRSSKTMLG